VIVIAMAGFLADHASKAWAFTSPAVSAGARDVVPGLITAILAQNDGAVAHLAGGSPMTPAICALNGLVMFAVAFWWLQRRRERWRGRDAVFAGLLFAGMLGNSIDRLALGFVRDFILTPLWPVLIFNLADVFIILGFLLLIGSCAFTSLRRSRAAGMLGYSC
jgi:signal peptidase II